MVGVLFFISLMANDVTHLMFFWSFVCLLKGGKDRSKSFVLFKNWVVGLSVVSL